MSARAKLSLKVSGLSMASKIICALVPVKKPQYWCSIHGLHSTPLTPHEQMQTLAPHSCMLLGLCNTCYMMYCTTQGHTGIGTPFLHASFVYWKMDRTGMQHLANRKLLFFHFRQNPR